MDSPASQAIKMRVLAARLRSSAAQTVSDDYRAKFEETAVELEDMAWKMERRAQFRLAS
jgi:hypothetical protein